MISEERLKRQFSIGALAFDDDGNLISPDISVFDSGDASTAGGASPRGSSYYNSVMACPRMWQLRYKLGLVPRVDRRYRLEGTLIHRALAFYWANRMGLAGYRQPQWHKPLLSELEQELLTLGRGFPTSVTMSMNVLNDYTKYYTPIEDFVPVAVEQCFYATIDEVDPPRADMTPEERAVGTEVVSVRPDVLGHALGGNPLKLLIMDHKTEGRQYGAKNADRSVAALEPWRDDGEHTISWQQMLYVTVMRAVVRREHKGAEVLGSTIQRVRRESPTGVARHDLYMPLPAFEQIPRTLRSVAVEARRIGADLERGIKPRWHTWSCQTRWGACDYREVCAAPTKKDMVDRLKADFIQIAVK